MAVYTRVTSAGGSGSSGTATFPDGPLPAGYVLVAFHYRNQGGAISTPSGWTLAGEDSSVSSRRTAVFVRRSDGTVNSITNTGSSVGWTTILMAYEADEPEMADGFAGLADTNYVQSMTLAPIAPTVYGTTVAFLRTISPTSGRSWGGGFEEAVQSANQFVIAERGGSTPATASVSWTSGAIQNSSLVAVHLPMAQPAPEKIPLSATRVSNSSVSLSWPHPGDATDGVSLVRAPGTHTNDGSGRAPDHVDYDPLTVTGAVIIAENETSSPYADEGLTPGEYTYWIVRTGA